MIKFLLNNELVETDVNPATTTLEFLREKMEFTGTKEGCGEGECGACTVIVGSLNKYGVIKYRSSASCLLPVGELNHKHLVTIEGVHTKELNVVQKTITENSASQCGFCTPGIVMSILGFILSSTEFSQEEAMTALDGNICRCTGYESIKRGVSELLKLISTEEMSHENRLGILIQKNVLPDYFNNIFARLKKLTNDTTVNYYYDIEKSVVIAGGTDLVVQKTDKLLNEKLVFLSALDEFSYIYEDDFVIKVSSTCTAEEIRTSDILNKYFPSLRTDLMVMSSKLMRNNGTLAGNIVNASPIGDLSIMFLAMHSKIALKKNGSIRVLKMDDFFKGYKKLDMNPGEIISEIIVEKPTAGYKYSFEKVSDRKILDIATCNTAMLIQLSKNLITDLKITAGGMGPIPLILIKTAEFLNGKELNNENVKEAGIIATSEVAPVSNIHGSDKYKKLLLKHLVLGHFVKLFPEIIKFEKAI